MTVLQRREHERREQREHLRQVVRDALRRALHQVLPGQTVYVYGSLVRPGAFHERSDVDVALVEAPEGRSLFRIQAELEERLDRPVDLTLLDETRLRRKIEAEGERWTS